MKVLMVITSHDQLGNTGRKTGFWLEELAAPYYVFKDAGAQITLASPKGGHPPLDPKSNEPNFQTDITRRFEKDADANSQLDRTVRLDSVKQEDYDTVFYPGGHGLDVGLAEDKKSSIKLVEILPGCRQDVRGGLPFLQPARCATSKPPGWQGACREQDGDWIHRWRGRGRRIDESGSLPCRRRNDEPWLPSLPRSSDWGVQAIGLPTAS